MPIDSQWLDFVQKDAGLKKSKVEEFTIEGIKLELPLVQPGASRRTRDWQRRVLDDIIPDSVNADAPERTPFRILWALTPAIATKSTIDEVMRDLEPLRPLFRAYTAAGRPLPIAFHVLAVRGSRGEADSKGFTERTFLLLCRRKDGSLDRDLVRDTVEAFRKDPRELDLAQRTVLERVEPNWDRSQKFGFELSEVDKVVPFDPHTGPLFQRDLRTLLDADLPPGDFFQTFNQLLMLHLGLYQTRVAMMLAPQADILLQELAKSDPAHVAQLSTLTDQFGKKHPIHARFPIRAPATDMHRPVSHDSPERRAYDLLGEQLHRFHFDVLLMGQIRRVTATWLQHEGWVDSDIKENLRQPIDILQCLQKDADFRLFFERSFVVLAQRFIYDQIDEGEQADQMKKLAAAPSGLHALKALYEHFNLVSAKNPTSSRAYRQGLLVTNALLRHNQYGLIQGRAKVGHFLQLGSGLLPLLLLLSIGARKEKAPVHCLWSKLEEYGFQLPEEEREQILQQLKAMGLYERYSDAGEAAYIRNLITA